MLPGVLIARAEPHESTVGVGTDFKEIAAAERVERLPVEVELAAFPAYAGLGEHQELGNIRFGRYNRTWTCPLTADIRSPDYDPSRSSGQLNFEAA